MFTTDPAISQKGFVLLEDDKRLQLADNVVPVVRQSLVQAGGDGFRNTLNAVSQKLTTEELTELNKSVSIDRRDVKDVAASWLRDKSVVR
jgi:osmoprotectant transport system substrate-binding protein